MMRATDDLGLSTRASMATFREQHILEGISDRTWVAEMVWDELDARGKLDVVRRQLEDGILQPRQVATGRNKVLLQGVTKTLTQWRDGTPYRFTHLELGTNGVATDEDMTGAQTLLEASAGVRRATLTEVLIDGKVLRTSTFIGVSEYNATPSPTIREGLLCDALTGGTPYNRVVFGSPVTKEPTDTAVCNIDHQLTN